MTHSSVVPATTISMAVMPPTPLMVATEMTPSRVSGSDTLIGGLGDDHLDGGYSRDILQGGEGLDALYGGDDDTLAGKVLTTSMAARPRRCPVSAAPPITPSPKAPLLTANLYYLNDNRIAPTVEQLTNIEILSFADGDQALTTFYEANKTATPPTTISPAPMGLMLCLATAVTTLSPVAAEMTSSTAVMATTTSTAAPAKMNSTAEKGRHLRGGTSSGNAGNDSIRGSGADSSTAVMVTTPQRGVLTGWRRR